MRKSHTVYFLVEERDRVKALKAAANHEAISKSCIITQALKRHCHRKDVSMGYTMGIIRGKVWDLSETGQRITKMAVEQWRSLVLPQVLYIRR